MKPDLVDRRERTFELLIVEGRQYTDVVETIAREYDITESGVRTDIERMDSWLPKIVEEDHAREDGLVRLKELRKNRQEMRRLYGDMKQRIERDPEADPRVLIDILERIDDNLDLDIALSQSLGHAEREPGQLEVEHSYDVNSEVVEVSSADVDGPGDEESD